MVKGPHPGLSRTSVFSSGYGALAWLCRAVSRRENRRCCPVGATYHSVIDFFCSRNKREEDREGHSRTPFQTQLFTLV